MTEVLRSDFQGPKNLCSLIDLSSLGNLIGLISLTSPISSKKFLIMMVWSSLAPKWTILVPFCGIDHQKSNFSLIFGIFSVGGCWGQAMLLFWKLVDETQMAAPREYTDAFIITKKLFLGGLRGLQSNSIWYETPCMQKTVNADSRSPWEYSVWHISSAATFDFNSGGLCNLIFPVETRLKQK